MTIGFSTKSGQWTSEYSFEPTCYANTDGKMIGFKDIGPKFWLHDDLQTHGRNKFYGVRYKSSMSVVSNENPSATKSYEAISLETSYDKWRVDVQTIDQEGSVRNFVERENDQYAELPKNKNITSANVVYVGTYSGRDFSSDLQNGSISLRNLSGSVSRGILCFLGNDGNLKRIENSGDVSDVVGLSSLSGSINTTFFDEQLSRISVSRNNGIRDGSALPSNIQIYIADIESGDSLRGDYLVVNIETTDSQVAPFELYAINVDQHKVQLDHSLGQNN